MTFSKRQDCGDREQISGCQGVGEGKCVTLKKQQGFFVCFFGGGDWGGVQWNCSMSWLWYLYVCQNSGNHAPKTSKIYCMIVKKNFFLNTRRMSRGLSRTVTDHRFSPLSSPGSNRLGAERFRKISDPGPTSMS